MRLRLINFLKMHPFWVNLAWNCARLFLTVWGWFVPIRKKTMLFASFGGRKFDDSPKAIYDEICRRPEFADWTLIWAFVDPDVFDLPRGEKVKVDTPAFFHALLYSRVWISNSGMDRGIELKRKGTVKVETWHGSPLKKIGGEEHTGTLGGTDAYKNQSLDCETIRCAQAPYDLEIFQRIFSASKDSFLLCDLPRNDELAHPDPAHIAAVRQQLQIPEDKQVLLYMPTYREYLTDEKDETYLCPPMDLNRWERVLGGRFVLLVRAHYAVSRSLGVQNSPFVRDVSGYPFVNDLYLIADGLISDYSSSFIDYSILRRPMFCFAYDLEEYEEKRGLYLDLRKTLPCNVCRTEDELLQELRDLRWDAEKTEQFRRTYAPFAGNASAAVVDEIEKRVLL